MSTRSQNRLRILAPTRYPWRFNSPRQSKHSIQTKNFLPLNRIDRRIEGITAFPPSLQRYDLIHAFNRIPIARTPYIIGFESHLPRGFGLEKTPFFRALVQSLAGERCNGIVAISKFAENTFRMAHSGGEFEADLMTKLETRYPNLELPHVTDDPPSISGRIHAVFVGHHFGRKGGCVAVRMAELATSYGIDLHVTIVSALEMGGGIWTDPTRAGFFKDWASRLERPNITWHERLDNDAVQEALRRAHFCLLPTFSDSFGYSALEAMANYCPMIATRQGALPEFIENGVNGLLLDLPVSETNRWVHSSAPNRHTPEFERIFTDEVERSAKDANIFWDRRYTEAVA